MKILFFLFLLSIFAVIKINFGFILLTLTFFFLLLLKPIDNIFKNKEPKKSQLTENKGDKNFFDSWPWAIFTIVGTILALYLMYKFQIGTKGMREAAYRGVFSVGIFGGGIYLILGIWDLIKKRIPKKNLIINTRTRTKENITPRNDGDRQTDNLYENEIYEQIYNEIEAGLQQKGLWARAIAEADGNESKIKSIYIKLRFNEIKTKYDNTDKKSSKIEPTI